MGGPVALRTAQLEPDLAVGGPLEPLLGDGWSQSEAGDTLQPIMLICVYADARGRLHGGEDLVDIGTLGSTWSTRWAARSAMRRPPQLGQKARAEEDQAVEAAAGAAEPREPRGGPSAAEEVAKLLLNKAGQPLTVAEPRRLCPKRSRSGRARPR